MVDHELSRWEEEGGAVTPEDHPMLDEAKKVGHAIVETAKRARAALAGVARQILTDEEPAILAAEEAIRNEAVVEGEIALKAAAEAGAAALEADVPILAPVIAAGEKAFEADVDKAAGK